MSTDVTAGFVVCSVCKATVDSIGCKERAQRGEAQLPSVRFCIFALYKAASRCRQSSESLPFLYNQHIGLASIELN
jgi:hypothetical protein